MRKLLLTGAICAVALANWLWLAGETPPAPGLTALESQGESRDAVRLRWRKGTAQRYALSTYSSMQMGGVPGSQPAYAQMQAALNVMTLDTLPGHVLVGMQLDSLQLSVNGARDPDSEAALAEPFRVHYSLQGMPTAFEFSGTVGKKHRSMLENIVRTFQITTGAGDTWVARETGVSGAYQAAYRRTAPLQIEKVKSDFDAPSTGLLAGAQLTSNEVIRLDAQRDWLVAMTVEETLQARHQGGTSITVTNRATLELQAADAPALTPASWAFTSSAVPPPEQAEEPALQMSAAQARREIRATVEDLDATDGERASFIHRLRDLVRVDASLPGLIVAELREGALTEHTRADLFLVLELAATDSAETALVAIMQDPTWSVVDASRAIVALGGVATPRPDSIDALWRIVGNAYTPGDAAKLAGDATFALGSLGDSLRQAEDPAYPQLRQQLLGGMWAGGGSQGADQQRANYVFAIGNTGDRSLTGEVTPLLADDSPQVRRAAALTLSVLGADDAAEDLMAQLKKEDNSRVRSAIAEALQSWTAPSASAMRTIRTTLAGEQDESVRYNMAGFLAANLDGHAENRTALQQLLRTEPSKRVRQAVANALAEADR